MVDSKEKNNLEDKQLYKEFNINLVGIRNKWKLLYKIPLSIISSFVIGIGIIPASLVSLLLFNRKYERLYANHIN